MVRFEELIDAELPQGKEKLDKVRHTHNHKLASITTHNIRYLRTKMREKVSSYFAGTKQ